MSQYRHRRIHYSFHLKVISEFSCFAASTSFKLIPLDLALQEMMIPNHHHLEYRIVDGDNEVC